MTSPESSPAPSARSPFAGCAILIAALLVMVFLIVFSTNTLFRQYHEIAKFTVEQATPVTITPIANQDAKLTALTGKIQSFRKLLDGDTPASLALNAEEINLAVAAYDSFKELRGTWRVAEIGDDTIRMEIAFPINGKPRFTRNDEKGWITSDRRYLVGTMTAHPALLKRELVLKIDQIDVPHAKVPAEFIEQMSPYRITERYVGDAILGTSMAKLTRVELDHGQLVLSKIPGEIPADVITNDQVDSASNRLFKYLALAACLFLVVAGSVVAIGLRAKSRRPEN